MRLTGTASLMLVSISFLSQSVAQQSPWQVAAQGARLSAADVRQLSGKTCWGFFDKGTNSETARGAILVRFDSSTLVGDFWRKWGKDAQLAAHLANANGYDYVGKTSTPQLSPSGTEITFRGAQWTFDWFIRPTGSGAFALRAINTTDSSRGAIGELHCN
jgi:hypothetical protein